MAAPYMAKLVVKTSAMRADGSLESMSVPIKVGVAPGLTDAAASEMMFLGDDGSEVEGVRADTTFTAVVRTRDAGGYANEGQLDRDIFEVGHSLAYLSLQPPRPSAPAICAAVPASPPSLPASLRPCVPASLPP